LEDRTWKIDWKFNMEDRLLKIDSKVGLLKTDRRKLNMEDRLVNRAELKQTDMLHSFSRCKAHSFLSPSSLSHIAYPSPSPLSITGEDSALWAAGGFPPERL
jgi:hypothetical protein